MAAVFTPLSPKDCSRVAASFELGELHSSTPVAHGSVNSIYRLVTDAGVFFLRLEEVKARADLATELRVVDQLAEQGFPCPRPRPLADAAAGDPLRFVMDLDGKCLSLTPLVAGEPRDLAQLGADHMEQVGELLGRLHGLSQRISEPLNDRFSPARIAALFQSVKDQLDPSLASYIQAISEEIVIQDKRRIERARLPQGIVHGDAFADNLFFVGDQLVALIDFDAAATRELIFDLTTAVNALCYRAGQLDWSLTASLLRGYQRHRSLSEMERQEWLWVWRLSSLRFTVTRIKDFHLRPSGTSGLIQRDFRDFYARLDGQRKLTAQEFWSHID